MDPLAELKQTFFQECEELLGALEQKLQALDEGSTDPEDVNAAFRAIHSIKGGAGAFGCTELVAFAHVFEASLDHLRSGRVADRGCAVHAVPALLRRGRRSRLGRPQRRAGPAAPRSARGARAGRQGAQAPPSQLRRRLRAAAAAAAPAAPPTMRRSASPRSAICWRWSRPRPAARRAAPPIGLGRRACRACRRRAGKPGRDIRLRISPEATCSAG